MLPNPLSHPLRRLGVDSLDANSYDCGVAGKRIAKNEDAEARRDPVVVGIGASAGGLAALKALFSHVPEDSGLAFVVVVHLAPDQKSHLSELLQPHVRLPVQQVNETVLVEADRVYVIPPNANLNSIDTHLRLSELAQRGPGRAPIDHFFRTLARTHDGHAIGVILTGTGSDGTLGVKEIKAQGGLTVVQDPNEAEYDGMPQSAIATGLIDLVLPLAKIPQAIQSFAHTQPKLGAIDGDDVADEAKQLLHKIFASVRLRTGRDFSRYKRSTTLRRIARRMQMHQIEDTADYLELLRKEPDEIQALADDLLITVTSFFRDPQVFQSLEEEVLPQIFAGKDGDADVRVWSVGCASGEEAFSLAILLVEAAARSEVAPRLQVFASDLHAGSLGRAREGFYPGDIHTEISPERLRRFFQKEDGGYRVRKDVREMVVFAPHNVLGDPPFSRLDLIVCRNLMIYLQREIQRDVIDLFHYALRPGGFLVVGTSETVDNGELFNVHDKKLGVHRKRNVPVPESRLPVFPMMRGRPIASSIQATEAWGEPVPYGALHLRMLEQHAPPSLAGEPRGPGDPPVAARRPVPVSPRRRADRQRVPNGA